MSAIPAPKFETGERLALVWSVGLIAAVISYLAIPWTAVWHWTDRADAANWVQAWGSVAAILAGAAGLAWQVRAQGHAARKLLVQQEMDALHSICLLLEFAKERVGHAFACARVDSDLAHYLTHTFHLDQLQHVRTALQQTDVRDVPGAWEKLAFLAGRDAFINALEVIEEMVGRFEATGIVIWDKRSDWDVWRGLLAKYRAELELRTDLLEERLRVLAAAY